MFCRNAEGWVYTLDVDYEWDSDVSVTEDMAFVDRNDIRRLEILRSGRIRVLKGYSWDGCTPKICFLDQVFGVPDGVIDSDTRRPKTYYASLIHDALYQFLKSGVPYSRLRADRFFLRLMSKTQFWWRYVYFLAVVLFGGIFGWIGRLLRNSRGRRVPFVTSDAQPPNTAP